MGTVADIFTIYFKGGKNLFFPNPVKYLKVGNYYIEVACAYQHVKDKVRIYTPNASFLHEGFYVTILKDLGTDIKGKHVYEHCIDQCGHIDELEELDSYLTSVGITE